MAAITTQEFEHHFKSLYKPLCLFALRYTDQVDDAEDIVQQAFADVWDKNRAGNVIGESQGLFISSGEEPFSFIYLTTRKRWATEQLPDVEDTSEEEDILRSGVTPACGMLSIGYLPNGRRFFLLSKRDGLKYQRDRRGIEFIGKNG